jgi:YVTN family beta-propeller protein
VALAINPITNKVYVANYGDNSVSVIDGLTNKIESRYSLGITPVALAINPITNKMYILDYISGVTSLNLKRLIE